MAHSKEREYRPSPLDNTTDEIPEHVFLLVDGVFEKVGINSLPPEQTDDFREQFTLMTKRADERLGPNLSRATTLDITLNMRRDLENEDEDPQATLTKLLTAQKVGLAKADRIAEQAIEILHDLTHLSVSCRPPADNLRGISSKETQTALRRNYHAGGYAGVYNKDGVGRHDPNGRRRQ